MTTQHRAQVTVDDHPVGELVNPARPDPSVFLYKAGTLADHAVSVTMPVQGDAYSNHGLHPIFAQNLPEGYLGDIVRKTIAKLYGPGDLTLLTALGRFQVGRVAVYNPDKANDATEAHGESLNELLNSVWWPLHYLVTFGRASCGLSLAEIHNALQTTGKSLQQQAQLIQQYRQAHPSFSDVGAAMEQVFLSSARDIDHYLSQGSH